MVQLFFLAIFSLILCSSVDGLMPCDDAYGAYCPEESGWGVGVCLKKQNDLSTECQAYIRTHDDCKAELEKHCGGQEYSGDAIMCLAEWTSQDLLSEKCKDSLPKKAPAAEKRKLTDQEKKKADARRKIRNKAAKMARDL